MFGLAMGRQPQHGIDEFLWWAILMAPHVVVDHIRSLEEHCRKTRDADVTTPKTYLHPVTHFDTPVLLLRTKHAGMNTRRRGHRIATEFEYSGKNFIWDIALGEVVRLIQPANIQDSVARSGHAPAQ
jgi:hypothetical protein